MNTRFTIEREDGKITHLELDAPALQVINDALNEGASDFGMTDTDEAEQNERAAWTFIDELKEFSEQPRFDSEPVIAELGDVAEGRSSREPAGGAHPVGD